LSDLAMNNVPLQLKEKIHESWGKESESCWCPKKKYPIHHTNKVVVAVWPQK